MPCMPSAVLAPHADAIVRRLDDSDLHVRHAASEMLGKRLTLTLNPNPNPNPKPKPNPNTNPNPNPNPNP